MSTINICTSLPQSVIAQLRDKGAVVHDACKILIIEVLELDCVKLFDEFLKAPHLNVDPVLIPHFGNPAAPYVAFNVQLEVYQLLAAYQPLLVESSAPGQLPPLQPAIVPTGGGFQYHHAKVAIHAVMQQIENPDPAFGLIGLNHVPSGSVVCDLNIIYANCVVVRRIRKF